MLKRVTIATIKAEAARKRKNRQKIKSTVKTIQRSVWSINEL